MKSPPVLPVCPGSVIASQGLGRSALPVMAGTSQHSPSSSHSQEVLCCPLGQRTCWWLVSRLLPCERGLPWRPGASGVVCGAQEGAQARPAVGPRVEPVSPSAAASLVTRRPEKGPSCPAYHVCGLSCKFQRGNKLKAVPVLKQLMF